MYFWSPDIFAFMVDPPQTTPKAKNGSLIYRTFIMQKLLLTRELA